jgi:hypothetical protein
LAVFLAKKGDQMEASEMIGKKVRVLAKPFGEGWAKEEYG